jgi:pyridoxal phosphate enzyme (YggS family)
MIKDNLSKVYRRVSLACSKINKKPDSIIVVAVSKGRGVREIKEAIQAGLTDIGENKVQEAMVKHSNLEPITYSLKPIKWHMLGRLQSNKVKPAVKTFDLIQSVDSLRLAIEIDKQASKLNKIQDILIEIKTSPEATKFGIRPGESVEAIKEITKLKNINIKGLMTIAPLVDNPEKTRIYFRQLRELRDEINKQGIMNYRMQILSMGMSDDFEVAIEESSNMIRLGRAIFEG